VVSFTDSEVFASETKARRPGASQGSRSMGRLYAKERRRSRTGQPLRMRGVAEQRSGRRARDLELATPAVLLCRAVRVPFAIPPGGSKAFDVVGYGLNSVDLLTVVAEYPATNTKQRLQRFARMPGGQIATATVTCARLGWRARYIGSFGDDDLGAVSRASLTDAG